MNGAVLGRDRELTAVRAALAAANEGIGGCLVLTGAAGIGKTKLIEYATGYAAGLGIPVASWDAGELDRLAPLTTLATALRGSRPPVLDRGPADVESSRLREIESIGEALERYAAARPLLIAIDDAQWADELSALALRMLVPALSSAPVRWLLARRPVPAGVPAQEAIDALVAEGAEQFTLAPLDDSAIARLCADVLDAEVDATVLSLATKSGGNPFLLKDLLLAQRAAGQLLIVDGTATVVGDELPSSFLYAVDQRLRGLSAEARTLLNAGSVLRRPFTVHSVAPLTGLRATDLLPAVDEAVTAQVLVDRGTQLAFSHDLLREAIYNNIRGPVRAALHREAAAVIRTGRGPAAEAADHVLRSGHLDDPDAVELLRDAATEVAGRAPGTAADLVVRALDMLDPHAPAWAALCADAVGLLASAGRVADAQRIGDLALSAGLDEPTRAKVLLGLAETLKHAGRNRDSADYAQRALALASVPEPVRARLYAIQAHALLYADDPAGADRAGAEAQRLGPRCGEYGAAVFAGSARSVVAHSDGRLDDALAQARGAVDLAERVGGDARQRHPHIWLGSALAALDRFAEAEHAYTTGRRAAEDSGTTWSLPLWHYYQGSLDSHRGRFDEASAEADGGLRVATELTATQLCLPLHGLLARIAVARGDMRQAHRHIRSMQVLLGRGITSPPEDVSWPIAVVQAANRDWSAALATLTTIYEELPNRRLLLSSDPACTPALVRIALRGGAVEYAEVVVATAMDLAARNPSVASLAGAAAHADGILRGDLGALHTAVNLLRDSPRIPARARAMEDTGAAEEAAGSRTEAVTLLRTAQRDYTACGARRSAERVADLLRSLGVRRTDAVRRAPATGSDALTEAELRVARLVADGLTNREVAAQLYLSRHTVDSHLRHAFTKLGINSRVELTRRIMALDEPSPT